jgi:hypothetical protein
VERRTLFAIVGLALFGNFIGGKVINMGPKFSVNFGAQNRRSVRPLSETEVKFGSGSLRDVRHSTTFSRTQ